MNNWMIILIINFASAFIMFHIYWMMYASCELDNEYFRHPFFEPEIWDYKDIIGILIGLVIWALLGILLACWSAVLMMGKHDIEYCISGNSGSIFTNGFYAFIEEKEESN